MSVFDKVDTMDKREITGIFLIFPQYFPKPLSLFPPSIHSQITWLFPPQINPLSIDILALSQFKARGFNFKGDPPNYQFRCANVVTASFYIHTDCNSMTVLPFA